MPRRTPRFPQTGWCTPHTDGCDEVYVPHLIGAVLVLCAPCAQVPSPRFGRIAARLHIDNLLTLGPYKSGDTVVPLVLSLVRAGGGGEPALCMYCVRQCLAEAWASACCETDTRSELLGGFRPCRPRVASLRACWRHLQCVVAGLRMRCASQISRQIMVTTAARKRAHEGRDKLPGPSSTALVHRTGMIAKHISGIVTGACCFCVHRVLQARGSGPAAEVSLCKAQDPVARVQLYYADVSTYLRHHWCSAYAPRSTISSRFS
jgi:hypothetical protein